MRVAFTGKGGSGKTTLSSLFSEYMASKGANVLAMDADINQHLAQALGCPVEIRGMGEHIDEIKRYVAGDNPRLAKSQVHKTTPPGIGSKLIRPTANDWFMKNFTVKSRNVSLAGAGDIPEENVGVKCYHGLNGAVELVLSHMIDGLDDVVVVDMTAGADAFSSSLFAKVDALVLVVEPTLKSLSVYDQFLPNTKEYGVPLLVVANKVEDESDLEFIKSRVGQVEAVFGPSKFVRRRERGESLEINELDDKFTKEFDILANRLMAVERDWDEMEARSHRLHLKNADSWMGAEAADQIDPSFSLKSAAQSLL